MLPTVTCTWPQRELCVTLIMFFLVCMQIAVSDLEPELQQRTTKTVLFYNKGL